MNLHSEPESTPISTNAIIETAMRRGLIQVAGQPVPLDKAAGQPLLVVGKMQTMLMVVTPKMANAWLERNTRNRKLNAETVTSYARDMRAGNWTITHQGIAFDTLDNLVDGQHRLQAIIEAGVSIKMPVTFGLAAGQMANGLKLMDCVDRGKTRSVADQLKVQHGVKDGTVINAVCGVIAQVCYGDKTKRLSVAQVIEIYGLWRAGIDHVVQHRSKAHGLRLPGVMAAFALAHHSSPAEAEDMYRQVLRPAVDESPEPGLAALRDLLTGERACLFTPVTMTALVETIARVIQHPSEPELTRDPAALAELLQRQPAGAVERVREIFTGKNQDSKI
jgi:hypothetical protein